MPPRNRAVLAALALLLLTACAPRFEEARTDPVTSPPPLPSTSAASRPGDMAGNAVHEVRESVERMIGGPDPELTVDCMYPTHGDWPCTARLRGEKLLIMVENYDRGGSFYKIRLKHDSRLLTRALVHREFYKTLVREEDGAPPPAEDQVRCDKMAELFTVKLRPEPASTDSGVRCYHHDNVTSVRQVWVYQDSQLIYITEDEARRRGYHR